MKIRPITYVCQTAAAAAALAAEYHYIGIATVRDGRVLTVTTRESGWE